jgi:hypothetical protein
VTTPSRDNSWWPLSAGDSDDILVFLFTQLLLIPQPAIAAKWGRPKAGANENLALCQRPQNDLLGSYSQRAQTILLLAYYQQRDIQTPPLD